MKQRLNNQKRWLKRGAYFLSLLLFLFLSGTPTANAFFNKSYIENDIEIILSDVPTGQTWIDHLNNDLLPFWITPEALGENGNYPTYRCNDGSLYEPTNPCPELYNADPGIVQLDRDYVRANSRQVFAYGIAYNMTGNNEYLHYAKEGVDYLIDNALVNQGTEGTYTYFDELGNGLPRQEQRISQDMTYALSGLAFFYYLTRDPQVLEYIVNVKDYIFDTYYDQEWGLLSWSKTSYQDGTMQTVSSQQRELVAQLDQIYAYMILITPILPTDFNGVNLRQEWEDDLVHLATIMSEQFYTPDKNLFWGAITDISDKTLETPHTDFGHSIKTLWLIDQIGKLTGHYDLVLFTQEAVPKILETAYLSDETWGNQPMLDGTINKDKQWWTLAELDQVAATFALRDPSYAKYLVTTYPFWLDYMVDHTDGGVWDLLKYNPMTDSYDVDPYTPKQHSWKNAFHSFEHAMIGYLTGQELHDLHSQLYFAFKNGIPTPKVTDIRPYTYAAKVKLVETFDAGSIPGYGKQRVTFADIR
ncbi:MAG: AGE family epimerase/isomerase [Crocosphaera sp.]|nr:AGE family epimerase/isomerase [Crocosphaera sp.]